MKCSACGYEHDYGYETSKKDSSYNLVVTKGDESFYQLTGNFDFTRDPLRVGSELKTITLHVCPKCRTVIFGG